MTKETKKQELSTQQQEPVSTQLLKLAIDKNADVDKLDRLMALQERYEERQAKRDYLGALAKFKCLCPTVYKTKSVNFLTKKGGTFQSKYAGLAESIDVIRNVLGECDLSFSWRTAQKNGVVGVSCLLSHKNGHTESTSLSAMPDCTGQKNEIQTVASTVSYLERYTLFAMLGLASKDMDDDGNQGAGSLINDEQAIEIENILKDNESIRDNFLRWAGVKSVASILANDYSRVRSTLDKKISGGAK